MLLKKKKKILIKKYKEIINTHTHTTKLQLTYNIENFLLKIQTIKKQMHYHHINIFTNKNFLSSTGCLLGVKTRKFKFFKKTQDSNSPAILKLKKILNQTLTNLYILNCYNFSKKHYIWIKKFYYLTVPHIKYIICSKSWNYGTKTKKRIKKRVYKLINKNR